MKSKINLPKQHKKQAKQSKKSLNFNSLMTRLSAFFVLMAIIPILVMGFMSFRISEDAVADEIQDKATIIVDNLNNNVNLFLDQNKNLVAFLATTKTLRSLERRNNPLVI